MRLFDKQFVKFLVVGLINTCFSYVGYAICLKFVSYNVSYSVSFVFGVLLSYFLNSKIVFKRPISFLVLLKYPSVYVVQYILGIVILFLGVELLGLNPLYVPLITVCISVPITFLMTKFILN